MARTLLFTLLFLSTASAQTIERGPMPRLCDNYGDPLPEGAIRRFGTVRFYHPDLKQFALVDDEKTLVTLGWDGTLQWWDMATGKSLRTTRLQSNGKTLYYLSHDGHTVALRNGEKVVFWDIRGPRPQPTHEVDIKGRDVRTLALAPDGSFLLGIQNRGLELVQLFRDRKPYVAVTFPDEDEVLNKLAPPESSFSADGGSWLEYRFVKNNALGVHDLKTGKTRLQLDQNPDGAGLSRTGATLATGTIVRSELKPYLWLKFFDVEQQRFTDDYQLPFEHCGSRIHFSPDDRYLAIGSSTTGLIFDRQTKQVVGQVPVSFSEVRFSRDSQRLFLKDGNHVRIWSVKDNREVDPRPNFGDGGRIHGRYAVGDDVRKGDLKVWELATGQFRFHQRDSLGKYWILGDTLKLVTRNYEVVTFDVGTGKQRSKQPLPDLRAHANFFPFHSIGFSADGQKLYFSAQNDRVEPNIEEHYFWDVPSGKSLAIPKHLTERDFDVALGIMAGLTGTYRSKNHLELTDVATGLSVLQLPIDDGQPMYQLDDIFCTTWHRAAAGQPAYLKVWDILTGKPLLNLPLESDQPPYYLDATTPTLIMHAPEGLRSIDLLTGKERGRMSVERYGQSYSQLLPLPGRQQLLIAVYAAPATLYDIRRLLPSTKTQLLTAKERLTHWASLASDDPVTANASTWALQRDDTKEVLAFLKQQLTTPAPTVANVQALIGELNDARFAKREAASKQLAALGRPIATLLRDAEKKTDSAEVRERLGKLLATLGQAPGTPEQRQVYRAIAVLERLASPEAITMLKSFATGSELAHVTHAAKAALARLAGVK